MLRLQDEDSLETVTAMLMMASDRRPGDAPRVTPEHLDSDARAEACP